MPPSLIVQYVDAESALWVGNIAPEIFVTCAVKVNELPSAALAPPVLVVTVTAGGPTLTTTDGLLAKIVAPVV